jgi:hypothetical protein
VSGIDAAIDALYRGPVGEFVAARNALAKQFPGAEGARVKGLPKPTAAAWAINQLYWQQRAAYDRLRRSGEKLRDAQVAVLNGKRADVRQAAETHRQAVSEAAQNAARLAQAAGVKVSPDALVRILGALSLAQHPPEEPGRLARALQPSGFEALAGISVRAQAAQPSRTNKGPEPAKPRSVGDRGKQPQPPSSDHPRASKREAEAARRREQAEISASKRAHAAIKGIRARVAAAERAETAARAAWERAKQRLDLAKSDLDIASRALDGSSSTPR